MSRINTRGHSDDECKAISELPAELKLAVDKNQSGLAKSARGIFLDWLTQSLSKSRAQSLESHD
jgi:hypothetical protein